MRAKTLLTTAIAAGVLATALVASPALAGTGQAASRGGQMAAQTAPDCDGTGPGDGTGARSGRGPGGSGQGRSGQSSGGQGMRAPGLGAGVDADLTDVASGTLTDDQRAALAAMAQEEKVARDLYTSFAALFDSARFDRIADAESQHLTEVRLLLDRYGMTDPTGGLDDGSFATTTFQDLYDTQLAAGSGDLAAAYAVAAGIETTDIADLTKAATGLSAPDVLQIYTNLLAGSERHLASFSG